MFSRSERSPFMDRPISAKAENASGRTGSWPLRVHTLGAFVLEVRGRPLHFAGKLPRRPLALLKVVIALGARRVPEVAIADALWPDADADSALGCLTVALHRLRALLDGMPALERRGGALSLNADVVWTDVWALQEFGADCRVGVETDFGCLFSMYGGPFLAADVDATWAVACRERLRARFVELVRQLALVHERNGDPTDTEMVWLRALDAEPELEPLYFGLMQSQVRTGRSDAALEVYRRCHATLTAAGRAPSHRLRDLAEQLVRSAEDARPSVSMPSSMGRHPQTGTSYAAR